jgi:hypothetical protein
MILLTLLTPHPHPHPQTGLHKYSPRVYEACIESFCALPIAALVDGRFFCVHGGISPSLSVLDDLVAVRFTIFFFFTVLPPLYTFFCSPSFLPLRALSLSLSLPTKLTIACVLAFHPPLLSLRLWRLHEY